MNSQILELIIFAGIAFLIISKLISLLGSVDEDERAPKKSYFGELASNDGLMDEPKVKDVSSFSDKYFNFTNFIDQDNREKIINGIRDIESKIYGFDVVDFIHKSKKAFIMIVTSVQQEDSKTIEQLVDKRFINDLNSYREKYKKHLTNTQFESTIMDSYSFGHACYITVKIENKREFAENWTFSKSAQEKNNIWYLTSIER